MSKKVFDDMCKEFNKTCCSPSHIHELTALVCLPKDEVSDEEIASYLINTSFCCVKNTDEVGSAILHAAASFGRKALCEWLIRICEVNVNVQDEESGYTPLHSSIYFGQINTAVSLIKYGADLSIYDKNTNIALDLVAEEFNAFVHIHSVAMEVYTWGINSNYTIGFSNEHSKVVPTHLEYFEKKQVIQVCMQKFHTLFVTEGGKVFGCGLTQGGRLGLSKEQAILVPQPITNFGYDHVHCLSVAAGRNHSAFFALVDKEYKVFTCGLNVYHQLGIVPAPDRVTVPTEITNGNWNDQIKGVAASTFHTVIWTQKDVYCCGYHGGQLGITKHDNLTVPAWTKLPVHKTNIKDNVNCVVVSDAATVVYVGWSLHIFHKYEKTTIVLQHILNFDNDGIDVTTICQNPGKIAVYGGVLDIKKGKKMIPDSVSYNEKLSIAHYDRKVLFYYEEGKSEFMRCEFTKTTIHNVNDFILNKRGLTITTGNGFAYICTFKGDLENDSCSFSQGPPFLNFFNYEYRRCLFDCDRIPLISRAIKVSSNPEGDNYAIIQKFPVFNAEPKFLEPSLPSLVLNDLNSFFDKTMQYETGYDVIYKVHNKMFPAHRYIVSSRCELLGTLRATKEIDAVETVEVFGIQPEIFRLILQYIYTLSCDLLTKEQLIEVPRPANPIQFAYYKKHEKDDGDEEYMLVQCSKLKTITRNAVPYTKYLAKCLSLFDLLDSLKLLDGDFEECDLKRKTRLWRFLNNKNATLGFLRDYYPSLCDVKLLSSNKVEMYAHKCMLMMHSEYFAVLLDHKWTKPIDGIYEIDIPLKNHVLNELLDFCYKGVLTENLTFNCLCELLIAADHFLMPVLKEYCKSYLVDHIDLRNVQSVLQFATMYNCENLRKQCIEFILYNLIAVLEFRILEDLNDNLLNEICEEYESRRKLFCGNDTVPAFKSSHSNIPNIAEIKKIHKECPTDIYAEENDDMFFKIDGKLNERLKLNAKLTKKSKKKKSRTNVNNGVVIPSTSVSTNNISSSPTADYSTSEVLNADNLKEDWLKVEKSSKGLKSRLKIISMINNFPDVLECKDDFTSLQAVQAAGRLTEHSPPQSFIENELITSPRSQMCMRVDLWDLLSKSSRRPRRHSYSSQQSNEPLEQFFSSTSPKQTSPWSKQEAKKETSFTDIVASELRQKKHTKINTIKCKSKRFEHMEMEDKAIQELIAFYGVNIVDDERISVTRVLPDGVSAPQWIIPIKKKNDLGLNTLN